MNAVALNEQGSTLMLVRSSRLTAMHDAFSNLIANDPVKAPDAFQSALQALTTAAQEYREACDTWVKYCKVYQISPW